MSFTRPSAAKLHDARRSRLTREAQAPSALTESGRGRDCPGAGARRFEAAWHLTVAFANVPRVRITPTRQRNSVSEGMALGLLMAGRDALPYDKVRVDRAFAKAWRGWALRDRFPQVSTDLSKGLGGGHVITRADKRRRVWNLFWERDGTHLRLRARPHWEGQDVDPDVVADLSDGEVTATDWQSLATSFLETFER